MQEMIKKDKKFKEYADTKIYIRSYSIYFMVWPVFQTRIIKLLYITMQ